MQEFKEVKSYLESRTAVTIDGELSVSFEVDEALLYSLWVLSSIFVEVMYL